MRSKNAILSFIAWVVLLLGSGRGNCLADSVMFAFQGRVKVNGVVFTGTGQFKFALINTEDHNRNVLTPNGIAPTYIDTGSDTYY